MSISPGIKSQIKQYLLLFLGGAILSFGLYNIHSPNGITEGGVLGATLLLQNWFGISPALSGFLMDITCYLIGFRLLGWQFAKYAIAASCGFAFFYGLYEQFPPIMPSLLDWPILAAVLGGCFVGIGVGIVVSIGGAAGGDDALALVINKLTHLPIERAYLFTDLAVLTLSLTYIPITKIVYSLITVTISSFIIGRIHGRAKPTS